MSTPNNEIDLLNLFANTILFFKKSKKIILSFFLIGILGGSSYYLIKAPKSELYYQKIFTAESNQVPIEMMTEIINSIGLKLRHQSGSSDQEAIASELGFSASVLSKLKMITAENKTSDLIEIKIEAYEKQVIDSVIKGVEYYVSTNEYVKNRAILIRSQKLKLLEVIDNMMEESLANKDFNKGSFESNASLINLLTKGNAGGWNYIELLEQKQKIERELTLTKDLDFVITSNPYEIIEKKAGVIAKVISLGFLGLFIGISLSLFLIFYKKAMKLIP